MTRNDDYLGYCEHGALIFWHSGESKPLARDYKSVYEMRRGSTELARIELKGCSECSGNNVGDKK